MSSTDSVAQAFRELLANAVEWADAWFSNSITKVRTCI